MKKIAAALSVIFLIGLSPLLMAPTGGFPYVPTFGGFTIACCGPTTIGTAGGIFNTSGNGTITFGPDSGGKSSQIQNTTTGFNFMQLDTTRSILIQTAGNNLGGAIDLETPGTNSCVEINSHVLDICSSGAGTTGVKINNNWIVPKIVAGQVLTTATPSCVASLTLNAASTCVRNSAGNFTIAFTTAFSAVPVCTLTGTSAAVVGTVGVAVSASQLVAQLVTSNTGVPVEAAADFICVGI